MKKHLLLVFLVLLTMVAYAGCGSSSDDTDGDVDGDNESTEPECKEDKDCEDGEVCSDKGVCEDAPKVCKEDKDCEDGEVCNDDGVCEAGPCTKDEDCKDGEVCNNGVCEDAPVVCTEDKDCKDGEVCDTDTGKCEAGPTPCTKDEDCGDNETCNTDSGKCEPKGCTGDEDCTDGFFCNDDKVCEKSPCTKDDDCEGDQVCNTETGKCEDPAVGCTEDEDCVEKEDGECLDTGKCYYPCTEDKDCAEYGDDFICDDGDCIEGFCPDDFTCETGSGCNEDGKCATCTCDADADCTAATQTCGGCFCEDIPCKEDKECPAGLVCGPGTCVEPVACPADVTDYTIMVTGGTGMLAQGKALELSAVLLDAKGNKVILASETNNFTWKTGDSDPATLAAADKADMATLTGGDAAGEVTLNVKLTCADVNVDVVFNNYPTATDARVVVFNSLTGAALKDVTVFLSNVATKADASMTTGDDGSATFTGLDCSITACDLHVIHADYTYVSAFGLMTNDILIPVSPNVDITVAGGVVGQQDHADIPKTLRGDIFLGISLFAIPGNLADLNFESLIGEMIETEIKLGTINEVIGLPGGLEGYLNPDKATMSPLKDGYKVTGINGSGTLWGLGGFTNIKDVLALAKPAMTGGEIEIGVIVAALIPIFANFYHGIMPGLEFTEEPKVDDLQDINGNGDTTDKVADFSKFVKLDKTFKLAQKQTQIAEVTYPALPKDGDTCLADSAITLMGVMQTGVGFIPLGLSASLDEAEDGTKDCTLEKVNVAFAPQHSGISGYTYYTLSVALDIASLTGALGKASGVELSGSIKRSDIIPTAVTLPDYLGLMKNTSFNTNTHKLTATAIAGADFHRVVFSVKDADSQDYWHIYWKDTDGFEFDFSALGQVADRTDKFSSGSLAQAIALENVTYDELFTFNATNLNDMNGFINAFSMATVEDATPAAE